MTGWLQADSFAWECAEKAQGQHTNLHWQGARTEQPAFLTQDISSGIA